MVFPRYVLIAPVQQILPKIRCIYTINFQESFESSLFSLTVTRKNTYFHESHKCVDSFRRKGKKSLYAGAFLRLWGAGGVSAAMLWLEILAASLFTFEATGSSLAVAAVSAARAAPLLLFGAVAGVMSDAWNRRSIVLGGLVLSAVSAGSVAMLGSAGLARPWHLAVAAFVSGCAYATEFPARRRMVAEAVPVEDRKSHV